MVRDCMVELFRFWYLFSNDNIAEIVLHDLDLPFEGTEIGNVNISNRMRNIAKWIGRFVYILMSAIEGQHCECCLSWNLPTFWRFKMWKVNIVQTVRASAKKCIGLLQVFIFAIEGNHCESCTLWSWPTFEGHKFETLISLNLWELAQNCLERFA